MIPLRAVHVPQTWGPATAVQALDANGAVYVLVSATRSEVYRLEGDRLERVGGPFLPPTPPTARPMSRLGDGTLCVMDREAVHLFDGARWTRRRGRRGFTQIWGPAPDELFAVHWPGGELLQRQGQGDWRRVELDLGWSFATWRGVGGGEDEIIVVGEDQTHSCIARRVDGRWRAEHCGSHTLDGARAFGSNHAAVWGARDAWVDRGGGWDLIPLSGRPLELIHFVASRGGHTLVGGGLLRPGSPRLTAQLGNLRWIDDEVSGPPSEGASRLRWTALEDGSVVLCGGPTLWITDGLRSSSDGWIAIDPFDEADRTARLPGEPALEADRRPVSNREWTRFCRDCAVPPPAHWPGGEVPPDREDHPVVGVEVADAERYARTRGMRLPTEPEWERIMEGADALTGFDWQTPTAPLHLRTRAMTGYAPRTAIGMEHMAMIWEWTSTPSPRGGHVVRGGPWRDRIAAPQISNRSFETGAALDVGFRCVRDLEMPSPIGVGAYR